MDITSVTVDVPVTDIESSSLWFGAVFERNEPDIVLSEGVAEYEVAGIWFQLVAIGSPILKPVTVRLGVDDARAEHRRISALGIDVSPVERVEGAIEAFDVRDTDGNIVNLYSLVDETDQGGSERGSDADSVI